jgi:transposase
VIRIDEIWLATEPLDMRAGPDTALARVIQVFGAARPHCAYLFANKRGDRVNLTDEQLVALAQGLPWQRIGEAGIISVL